MGSHSVELLYSILRRSITFTHFASKCNPQNVPVQRKQRSHHCRNYFRHGQFKPHEQRACVCQLDVADGVEGARTDCLSSPRTIGRPRAGRLRTPSTPCTCASVPCRTKPAWSWQTTRQKIWQGCRRCSAESGSSSLCRCCRSRKTF